MAKTSPKKRSHQQPSTPEPVRISRKIKPRNPAQQKYIETIEQSEVCFGLGPAGTGKTFLAVAAAVEQYMAGRVDRIILVRPAVEAGERLGFLPGTLQDKVDPYLRPLYDALYELVDPAEIDRMFEDHSIEVAPLAFMRGRTLGKAFIIMDEAQNTTSEQMKMFLTRMGPHSKVVVNGDLSQIDLQRPGGSGLREAVELLDGVEGVGVYAFTDQDVVRHRMVQRIVRAYEANRAG